MVKYIGKRLLTSIVTVWAVVTIVFFLVRMMPGGPFDGEKITPDMKAQLNEKYGLDKPVGEQYTIYMKNLLKGDFGKSMKFSKLSKSWYGINNILSCSWSFTWNNSCFKSGQVAG